MLKIVLKEPLPDAIYEGGVRARSAQYLLVQGTITENLAREIATAKWYTFVEPGDNPVLIPTDNIAYIQEQLPSANQKVS